MAEGVATTEALVGVGEAVADTAGEEDVGEDLGEGVAAAPQAARAAAPAITRSTAMPATGRGDVDRIVC